MTSVTSEEIRMNIEMLYTSYWFIKLDVQQKHFSRKKICLDAYFGGGETFHYS